MWMIRILVSEFFFTISVFGIYQNLIFWVLLLFDFLSFFFYLSCHNLTFITIWVLLQFKCCVMSQFGWSFVAIYVLRSFHNLSFWVLGQFEFLSFFTIWVCELVAIWVFDFCHYMSFWVVSQFGFGHTFKFWVILILVSVLSQHDFLIGHNFEFGKSHNSFVEVLNLSF